MDKHAWEFALFHEARTALRAGDLTVEGSQRYAAWDSEQALSRDADLFLSTLLDQLHRQTQRTSKRMGGMRGSKMTGWS
jgi:hypothetical protein